MTRYLISFNDGAMDHIPGEDMPAVAKAAHAVVQEVLNAGVYLFAGGLEFQRPSVVATDGTVTDGPYPQTKDLSGGVTVVDVPTREAAWSGPQRSRPPAAVRRRYGSSGPTPNSTRCSARQIAGGDVPARSDRRRPATLEQDLPWRRSDDAGLRIDLNGGREPATPGSA